MRFEANREVRVAHDHEVYQVEIDGDELRIICYFNWQDTAEIYELFQDDEDCEGVTLEMTLTDMIADVIDMQSNRVGEVSHAALRNLRTILFRAVAVVNHTMEQRPDLDGKYPEERFTVHKP